MYFCFPPGDPPAWLFTIWGKLIDAGDGLPPLGGLQPLGAVKHVAQPFTFYVRRLCARLEGSQSRDVETEAAGSMEGVEKPKGVEKEASERIEGIEKAKGGGEEGVTKEGIPGVGVTEEGSGKEEVVWERREHKGEHRDRFHIRCALADFTIGKTVGVSSMLIEAHLWSVGG